MTSRPKIFISYSRVDSEFAARLSDALELGAVDVLRDVQDILPTEEWKSKIELLMAQSDTIVYAISSASVSSTICHWELETAEKLNKRLAPVIIEAIADDRIPPGLAKMNYIDFTDQSRFIAQTKILLKALRTDLAWVRRHTELAEAARRWREALPGFADELLLRGQLLSSAQEWLRSKPAEAPEPTADQLAFISASHSSSNTRHRKWVAASLAFAMVALGLATAALYQSKQSHDNEQLARAEGERTREQKERADAELGKALTMQSRFLASRAWELIRDGDLVTGTLLALAGLSHDASRDGEAVRPYVPEAEFAADAGWRIRTEMHVLKGHQDGVVSAVFSPNGYYVAAASADHTARLWEARTGSEVALLKGHRDRLSTIEFSPDGSRVVTSSEDATARIWDIPAARQLGVLRGHDGAVNTASFSNDGARIVTAGQDGTARIWEAGTGKQSALLSGHDGAINIAAFDSAGSRVVTASSDSTARIWDVSSGRQIVILRGHEGGINMASFSPDGAHVVTAGNDGFARIFDAATGREMRVLSGHGGAVNVASFSFDGTKIVTASADSTARVWDASTGRQIAVLKGHRDSLSSAAFSPDGRRIVTASRDNSARLWDLQDERKTARLVGHQDALLNATFSPDGTYVVTASFDKTARIWRVPPPGPAVIKAHRGAVHDVTISLDSRLMVTASADQTAKIWEMRNGSLLTTLEGHSGEVYGAVFSSGNRQILTASADGTARIWDVQTGAPLVVLRGHRDAVYGATFSPRDDLAVTASADRTARIWDTRTGAQVGELIGHQDWIRTAVFSPDGSRIATASDDRTARVWDLSTKNTSTTLSGHQGRVNSVAFSVDGTMLLTASTDGTSRLWSVKTGAEIRSLELKGRELAFLTAAFSTDGTRVVTASEDNTVRVWDVRTGQEVANLQDQRAALTSAVFDPGGTKVVATFEDGSVRTWDVYSTSRLTERVKEEAPRCLTSAQRSAFFLDSTIPRWCIDAKKWPFDTEPELWDLLAEGKQYLQNQAYEKAADQFRRAVGVAKDASYPEALLAEALNGRAWELFQNESFTDALPYAVQAVSMAPDNGRFLDTRGHILLSLNRLDEAVVDLDGAIENGHKTPGTYVARGLAHEMKRANKLAAEDYALAVAARATSEFSRKAQDQAKERLGVLGQ